MGYEQVRNFYPNEMGKEKGWCLKNCRLGFRSYTATYSSAYTAMLAGKRNGTLHDIESLPLNCAVPVYFNTSSKNKHVVICDKGVWWEDGKKINKPTYQSYGWDEMVDGVRVVKEATSKFLPSKGYWAIGDKDARIGVLASFMRKNFPVYTSKKALGNYYGNYLASSIKEFQRRTGLYPDGCTGQLTYNKLKQYGFTG